MSTRSGPGSLIERAEWIKHSLTAEASDILTELVDENERLLESRNYWKALHHELRATGKKTAPTPAERTYT